MPNNLQLVPSLTLAQKCLVADHMAKETNALKGSLTLQVKGNLPDIYEIPLLTFVNFPG